MFIDKEESGENEKWTDRALMLEYGRINSIEAEENVKGGWIQRIRARLFPFSLPNPPPRYGTDQHHQWSPWRRTGNQATNQSPNLRIHQLEFSSNHQLSGYSSDSNGILYSICQTNLDNGEQQLLGLHEPKDYKSLIVAPSFSVQPMLRLSHLSGNEQSRNYSICFNLS